MVIDLPFEGRKVKGSRKYSRRERVPKVRSRGEETITEPINSRIGEFHNATLYKNDEPMFYEYSILQSPKENRERPEEAKHQV